jgi:hypothetical protein
MRALFLTAALVSMGGSGLGPASGRTLSADWWTKRVSVNYKAAPFRRAIANLFEGTHQRVLIAPETPNVPIHLAAHGAPMGTVLQQLLAQAGAIYRLESPSGGAKPTLVIGKRPTALH